LQFPLFHPAVAAVIPGARNEAEISSNVHWMQAEIPVAFWQEMKREGLVPEHAPTG
jgi:D-threo-aldose 1-dehydrogenase